MLIKYKPSITCLWKWKSFTNLSSLIQAKRHLRLTGLGHKAITCFSLCLPSPNLKPWKCQARRIILLLRLYSLLMLKKGLARATEFKTNNILSKLLCITSVIYLAYADLQSCCSTLICPVSRWVYTRFFIGISTKSSHPWAGLLEFFLCFNMVNNLRLNTEQVSFRNETWSDKFFAVILLWELIRNTM